MKTIRLCTFENCERKYRTSGYCMRHYNHWRKYGRPLTDKEIHEARSLRASKKKNTLGKRWKIAPEIAEKRKGVTRNKGKTHFKKGYIPWNKGLKGLRTGELHHNWKGGVTPRSRIERVLFRQTLQKTILSRDDYTCQMCGQRGVELQIDHIKGWAEYPELRFDISNCQTLCMGCHYFKTFNRKMPEGIVWGHGLNKGITS